MPRRNPRAGEPVPATTGTVLVIEHETNAGLDLMSAQLGESLEAGIELMDGVQRVRVVRPYLGDQLPDPDDLAEHGGLIVLGGSMGALDDDIAAWLPSIRRLLVEAVRREVPTLGICLGAQLLAAACGGTVQRGAAGVELGLVPVTPLASATDGTDPFFGRLASLGATDDDADGENSRQWEVNQYHFDAVTRLPADGQLLVTGERYPHQGFRVGAAAWGVQYHPEVSTGQFIGWVGSGLRSGELTGSAEQVIGPIQAGEAAQLRVAAAHATAFVDVVRHAASGPA